MSFLSAHSGSADPSGARLVTFATTRAGRENNLNLLRLIAAAAVLYSHSYALTGHMLEEPVARATGQRTDAATIGVVVFFAISGYLITQSLARSTSLARYALARFLRIVPGLVIAKLLCATIIGWWATSLATSAYWRHPDTWRFLLGTPFFGSRDRLPGVFAGNPYPLAVNGSLWTLPVEAWCYAGAASIAIIGLTRRRILLAAAVAAAVTGYAYFPAQSRTLLPFSGEGLVPALVGSFLFGALVYAGGRWIPVSLGLAAAALVAIALAVGTWSFRYFYCTGISYVALVLAYHPRLLVRRYLRVGDYSYGTYVLAFPVQQLIVWRLGVTQPLLLLGLASMLTLPLAMLSWHFVEEPALSLKHRLGRARSRRTAAAGTDADA